MKRSSFKLRSSFGQLIGLSLIAAVGAWINWTVPSRVHAQTQAVSANDVLPVLQRCFQCHGPSLKMSKLDLSSRDGMLKGGEKGPALVPGNAEASPLFRRIAGLQAPAMPMPPVAPLNAQEVTLIRDWINQGANWSSTTPASAVTTSGASVQTYPGGYRPREITEQDRQ